MSSGVAVNDDCVTKFQELKLGHALRFIVYKVNDSATEIVVDKSGGPSASYQEFVKALPADECRWGVFDFEFTVEGGNRSKILFVLWAPDSAKIKGKMLYTSSKADLRKKLVGIQTEIQATDQSEIDFETVLEKAKKDTK